MDRVSDVFENLVKVKEKKLNKKNENKVTENAVSVDKVMKALANKRGDEYTEQIKSIDDITELEDGYVVKLSVISGDATEKTGDFLTDEEINNVEINTKESKEEDDDKEDIDEGEEKTAKEIIEEIKEKRKVNEGVQLRLDVLGELKDLFMDDDYLLEQFARAMSDEEFFDIAEYIFRMEGSELALDLADEIDDFR